MFSALPRTSGGVCVLEDIHRLDRSQLNRTLSILMCAAEDGKVAPAKAAAATYQARVALHMNANPQSSVGGERPADGDDPAARLLDLNLPFDVCTRVDVVLPLGSGDDAARAAAEMVVQDAPEPPLPPDADPPPIRRATDVEDRGERARLLVARLLERFPAVTFGDTRPALRKLMKELTLVVRQATANMDQKTLERFDVEGLFRRMANAVRKLLGGLARLKGRGHVTVEDVEEVWSLLKGKLELIQWVAGKTSGLRPLGARAEVVKAAREASEARFLTLLRRFGGERFSAEDMAKDQNLSVRAVQREFADRGYRPHKGYYDVPLEAEWKAEQEALLARGEEILPAAPCDDEDLTPTPNRGEDKLDLRPLVPPLEKELYPVAAALRRFWDSEGSYSFMSSMLVHWMLSKPPHPIVVHGIAQNLVTKLMDLSMEIDPAPHIALLEESDWEKRGLRILSLLVYSDYPQLELSLSAWRLHPMPGHLGTTVAAMADLREARVAAEAARVAAEQKRRGVQPEAPRERTTWEVIDAQRQRQAEDMLRYRWQQRMR